MPPRFGPAPVHLDWHKTITGFGSVRASDSSAPQPPGACAGRLLCFCSVNVQSPNASGERKLAVFLWEIAVGLRPEVFSCGCAGQALRCARLLAPPDVRA